MKIQISNEPTINVPRELIIEGLSVGLTQQINLIHEGEIVFEGPKESRGFGVIFGDNGMEDPQKRDAFLAGVSQLFLAMFFPETIPET